MRYSGGESAVKNGTIAGIMSGPATRERPGPDTEGDSSMPDQTIPVPLRDRSGATIAYAVIDVADAHLLEYRWYLDRFCRDKMYAKRRVRRQGVFLHRAVMGLEVGDPRRVDHINGVTLDNRRANLRIATVAENAQNQGSRGGSSRYRGVAWDRSRGKWIASATLDGRRQTIGRFVSEDEAGEAAAAWRREHMPFSAEAA